MVTQAQLKEALIYNPDTGIFTWISNRSTRIKAGDVAGCIGSVGYPVIRFRGKLRSAHRLAFLYMTGHYPDVEIDHINGVRDDNRWINLRDVTRQENCRNSKRQNNNTSGICGVSWANRNEKWVSNISNRAGYIRLYYGCDFFEACCARKSAEIAHGYHENHGR